jgi:hypothetical protein
MNANKRRREERRRRFGKWLVKLEPLKVGDASELSVAGKDNEVSFQDVLVGNAVMSLRRNAHSLTRRVRTT